ncbi:MAG: glycoside hydrolase, partial [Sphingobacteriaceae bacterium]
MKKTIMVALLLMMSIGAGIAAITSINGKWLGPLHTPDDNTTEVEYNFTTDGSKVTGKIESVFGSALIE